MYKNVRVLNITACIVVILFLATLAGAGSNSLGETYDHQDTALLPIYNPSTGVYYDSFSNALADASSGDTLVVSHGTFNENLVIDGIEMNVEDSSFSLVGDISIKNGGVLNVDPTYVNLTGNIWVGAGELNITDNTVVQINSSYDGEFGIQVNATGEMYVQNGSVIRSGTAFNYGFVALDNSVLHITNSTISDCGWNDANPGIHTFTNDVLFQDSTITNSYNGLTIENYEGYSDPSLAAWYRMDEEQLTGAGEEVKDSSGNGNNGTSFGGVEIVDGYAGRGYRFNGGQQVQIPYDASINIYDTLTVSLWVKPDSHTDQKIVTKSISTTSGFILGISSSGELYPEVWDTGGARYSFEAGHVPIGEWSHVVFTWETGNQMAGYINGQQVDAVANGANNIGLTSTEHMRLGTTSWGGHYYDGDMDDVRIYNRVMTPAEINATYMNDNSDYFGGPIVKNVTVSNCNIGMESVYSTGFQVLNSNFSDNLQGLNIIGSSFVNIEESTISNLAPSNPVYNYRLDEEYENAWWDPVEDSSGNGYDGYYVGSSGPGIKGNSFECDGSSGQIYIPNDVGMDITGDFTIEAWFYLNETGRDQFIISKGHTGDPEDTTYEIYVNSTNFIKFGYEYGGGTNALMLNSTDPVSMGKWYHVAVVQNGLTSELYVNGEFNNSVGQVSIPGNNNRNIDIGARYNGAAGGITDFFNGYIDEVRMYHEALTPSQIAVHAQPISGAMVLDSSVGVILEKCTMADENVGAYLLNGSQVESYNGSFSAYSPFGLENGSDAYSLNNTGEVDAVYQDDASTLTVDNYLNVYVHDGTGPIIADVYSYDQQKNLELLGTTDATGWLNGTIMNYYTDDGSNRTYSTPHNIYADDLSPYYGSATVNMSSSQTVYINNTVSKVTNVNKAVSYPGIQLAVDDADDYDEILVHVGNVEENVIVDRPLEIHGDGSDKTNVNGGGTGPVFTIEADRVFLNRMNITNTGTGNYGVLAHNMSFGISYNTFYVEDDAVAINVSFNGTGDVYIPQTTFYDNDFNGTGGIRVHRFQVENLLPGSDVTLEPINVWMNEFNVNTFAAVNFGSMQIRDLDGGLVSLNRFSAMGNVIDNQGGDGILFNYDMRNLHDVGVLNDGAEIYGNKINVSRYGMLIGYEEMKDFTGSTAVFVGEVEIVDNFVTSGGLGISLSHSDYEDYYDDARATILDQTIFNNTVDAGNRGIYLDYYDQGADLFHNSQFSMGTTLVANNTVTSSGASVELYGDYRASNMHDFSSVSLGPVNIWNNSVNSSNQEGICLDMMSNGYQLYDRSNAEIGKMSIMYNDIEADFTGIRFQDCDRWGQDLHNNASVNIAGWTVHENTIYSHTSRGIDFEVNPIFRYHYDDSISYMGDILVTDNVVNASDSGIEFQIDYLGRTLEDNSITTFGDILVLRNNVISRAEEGIYFDGFDGWGQFLEENAVLESGDIVVEKNTVDSALYGIYYRDFYNFGADNEDYSSYTMGSMITDNNTIVSGDIGIYVRNLHQFGYSCDFPSESTFWMGDFSFCGNTIDSNSDGMKVEINEMGHRLQDGSQARFGNFLFDDNHIVSTGGNGINLNDWHTIGSDLSEDSSVRIGDVSVSRNNVTAFTFAITMNFWSDFGSDMNGTSSFAMGEVSVCENAIWNHSAGAIRNSMRRLGAYMYGQTQVSTGIWNYSGNDIMAGSGDGIEVGFIQCGYRMYEQSRFNMKDVTILGNTVNVSDAGIILYLRECSYQTRGSSRLSFGSFLVNENDVHTDDDGIYSGGSSYIGYGMKDKSSAVFGDFEINNNTVNTSVSGLTGITLDMNYVANEFYGDASMFMGHCQINDNDVTSNDNKGIYVESFNNVANYMYVNSRFHMENFEVCRNDVYSNHSGIYLGNATYLAYEMYDSSRADFGSFLFNWNHIESNSFGLRTYNIRHLADEMYDLSQAHFGDFEYNNNSVSSTDSALHIKYIYYWGTDLYGSNNVTFGHVQMNDNYLNSSNDGLYLYYFYDIGVYMEGQSYFRIENFEMQRNEINASNYGIYLYEIDELAYYNYESSVAVYGDFLVCDNNILSGNDGFYNRYVEYLAYYMYDNSVAYFGDFRFNNNTINSTGGTGMYFYRSWYENAYNMYENSRAYFGKFQINDNTINASSYGIEFDYYYEVGAYMDDNSYAEFGNFEMCRNDITSGSDGIYLYEWYYVGYENEHNSKVYFGDFLFNNNTIDAGEEGIYIYAFYYWGSEMYDLSEAHFGDIQFNGNHITSGYEGIYIYYFECFGYYLYVGNNVTFGDLEVNENNITSGLSGTYGGVYVGYLDYLGYDLSVDSYFSFGNIEYCNNTVNATDEGFYLDYFQYWGYYLYGTSEVHMGDFLFNDNHITSGDDGLYIDYLYYLGYEMDDSSVFTFGNIEINRNWVNAGSDGLYTYMEYFGSEMYGQSRATFGYFQMNENNITSVDVGLDLDDFYQMGSYMYDSSYFSFGDVEIRYNVVNSTNSNGIDCDLEYLAYYMYDQAQAHYGDFLFNQNEIVSDGHGIYIDYWDDFASYMYGDNLATFGDFEVNNNTIDSNGSGIYHEYIYDWGYEMYQDSYASFGHVQFNDNIIFAGNNVTSSYGIFIYEFDHIGSYMYGNSHVQFENWEMLRNVVTSTSTGIDVEYIEYCGYEMYQNSRAEFGDILINENDIISGYNGIYIYEYMYNGYYMYDNAVAIFQDFEINDNVVSCENDGIKLSDWNYIGYNCNNYSYAEFGDFNICGNDVTSNSSYGIYVYLYDVASTMAGHAEVVMGDWNVCDNVVSSNDSAIYFYTYEIGYWNQGDTTAHIGDLRITDNDAFSRNDTAILAYWWYWAGYSLYENAQVEFGHQWICNNTAESHSNDSFEYGIETGPMYAGYNVLDNSYASFGNSWVTDNQITTTGCDGFTYNYYNVAVNLATSLLPENRARVIMGDTIIHMNTIDAMGGDGAYIYGDHIGNSIYDYANVSLGDIFFTENQVSSDQTALVVEMMDVGYSIFNHAVAETCGVYIQDNVLQGSYEGLSFYSDYVGYNLRDYSTANLGSWEITGNDVTGDVNGINMTLYWLFVDLDNYASASMDHILLDANSITCNGTAINVSMVESVYVYGEAFLAPPDLIFSNHALSGMDTGIAFNGTSLPGSINGAATVEDSDFLIEYNDFSNARRGAYISFESLPAMEVMQPTFMIRDNSVVSGATGESAGFEFYNTTRAILDRCFTDNVNYSIMANNSGIYTLNGTFQNMLTADFYLENRSNIYAVNNTDGNATVFDDALSRFYRGWFMNVRVESTAGLPVPTASVSVKDAYGTEMFNGTTGQDGYCWYTQAYEFMENNSGVQEFYNPHNASAWKGVASGYAVPEPVMDTSKVVIIVLGDSTPPVFVSDDSDPAGTTGDPYSFEATITDDVGFYQVWVHYQYGAGPVLDGQMEYDWRWHFDLALRTDFVGIVTYNYEAIDVGNHVITSGNFQMTVTDNDSPILLSDNSDRAGFGGATYDINVEAEDNVGLNNVYAEYWYDGGAKTNVTLSGTSTYTTTITLQSSPLTTFDYKVTGVDAAGNWFAGKVQEVPVFVDGSTGSATTGDDFSFNMLGSMSIYDAHLNYWYGGGPITNVSMGAGPYECNTTVPHQITTLNYQIVVYDGLRWIHSEIVTKNIIDNDLPEMASDATDTTAETGNPFTFQFTLTDNVGVENATLSYWFGMGNVTTVTLNGTGPHNHVIPIPVNSTETLRYTITIYDTSGNVRALPQENLPVVDVLPPSGFSDQSDAVATTGDIYSFSVNIYDNINISAVHVVYWYDGYGISNSTMYGSQPYELLITAFPNTVQPMHYYVAATDDAGNWFISSQVEIPVTDNDAPVLLQDASDAEGYTGAPYDFNFTLEDNIAVANAHLVYWYGTDAPVNETLTETDGNHLFTTTPPLSSTQTLHYYVTSVDDAGNWMMGQTINIPIIDNIAPSGFNDLSDAAATTGDLFTFEADVSDNVGVDEVHVVYWYGSGTPVNATLDSNATYAMSTDVPHALDVLQYYFAVVDESENWLVTDQVNVTVTDNDAPVLTDLSDDEGYTGYDFTFEFNASDNIGLENLYLEYWFGTETPVNVIMNESTGYSLVLSIEGNQTGNLAYTVLVEDTSGNSYSQDEVTVPIRMSFSQADLQDMSMTEAYTGDPFTFAVELSGNLSAQDVYAIYWYGSGEKTNETMAGTTNYSLDITVRWNTTENLRYKFIIHGADDNWYYGPEYHVPVQDNDAPWLGVDYSDGEAYQGRSFTFQTEADDNIGVSQVRVIYKYTNGTQQNVSLSDDGSVYTTSIIIPGDEEGNITYRFLVEDTSGNWFEGENESMEILDSTYTADIMDLSDASGQTGGIFTFRAELVANSTLQEISVIYWYGAGSKVRSPLEGSGPFALDITIPENSVADLHYYFNASDGAGNYVETVEKSVPVIDTINPTIVTDSTHEDAYAGETLRFAVGAWDNIAIYEVYLTYAIGSGTSQEVLIGDTVSSSHEIPIPVDATGTVTYAFRVTDQAGNEATSQEVDIDILDRIPPQLIQDLTPMTASTSGQLTFEIEATDNIAVGSVTVTYWAANITETVITLTEVDGTYQETITIPSNLLDALHYQVNVTDTSGNYATSASESVFIIDGDIPEMGTDGSDATGQAGESFTFETGVSDNGEIASVYAVYTYEGDDTEHRLLLTEEDGVWTGTFIPSEEGAMTYHFEAVDRAGNVATSAQNSVTLDPADADAGGDETSDGMPIWPFIVIIILVIIIIILLVLLLMKGKGGEEEPMEPKEVDEGDWEPEDEALAAGTVASEGETGEGTDDEEIGEGEGTEETDAGETEEEIEEEEETPEDVEEPAEETDEESAEETDEEDWAS